MRVSLVRALSRPDIGCTCNVTFIVQGWPVKGCRIFRAIDFLFENFARAERRAPNFCDSGAAYVGFYGFRGARGTIEHLSIPGRTRPMYFIFHEPAKTGERRGGGRGGEGEGGAGGREREFASVHSHPFPRPDIYLRLDRRAGGDPFRKPSAKIRVVNVIKVGRS